MPEIKGYVEYWYASTEEKAYSWTIKYIRKILPEAGYVKVEGIGHAGLAGLAGLAVLNPSKLADRFRVILEK